MNHGLLKLIRVSLLIFVLALLPSIGWAQINFGGPDIKPPEEYVSWQVTPRPSNIGPGGSTVVEFSASILGDWKMYALDSTLPSQADVLSRPYGVVVTWDSLQSGYQALEGVGQNAPETGFDQNFNLELQYFHKQASFFAGVTATDQVLEGTSEMRAKVRYQICSDSLGTCLRPTTVVLSTQINYDPTCIDCSATDEGLAKLIPQTASEGGALLASSDYESYRSNGFWGFILLAIGAGLASLLTPCVFPMIPLTVSYFTRQGQSRSKAIRMSLIYGASIVITFTGIGVVMAVLVGAAGASSIASNPWVNLLIAAVLIGFALSLLGLFELRLPNALLNWVGGKGQSDTSWSGVLFMGLTLTLVSFSCTAPFVGGLLAAASGGTWAFPLFGMVAYSATFALPFVLLSLFPRALQSLPSSGSWMNSVKVILGFIELAAAIKFLSNADLVWRLGLLSRTLGIAIVLVLFFLAGMYLLGKLRLAHEEAIETLGVGRLFAASLFFVICLYLLPGLFGAPLPAFDAYLPPQLESNVSFSSLVGSGEESENVDENWFIDDIEGAFAAALDEQKPVFVDFSGWTCTNCRQMEATVFRDRAIVTRFEESFVTLRLYTDDLERGDEFHQFQMQLTGTPALPTFAIVSAADRSLIVRSSALMSVEEFGAFLDSGLGVTHASLP